MRKISDDLSIGGSSVAPLWPGLREVARHGQASKQDPPKAPRRLKLLSALQALIVDGIFAQGSKS